MFGKGNVKTNNPEASPGLFARNPNFGSNNNMNLFGVSSGMDMLNLNFWMMNPSSNNNNSSSLIGSQNLIEQSPGMNPQQGGQIQTVSAYPDNEDQKNNQQSQQPEKVYTLVEKPSEEFNPGDFQNLHYAIVDINAGTIYFITPVTRDNFPPNIVPATPGTQARNRPTPNTGDSSFIMSSPALGNVSFSPNLFGNNNLMSLVKNQLSPGMNFFNQESPNTFFHPDQGRNLGNWSTEWTPDTSSRPFNRTDSNSIKPASILWGGGNQMKINSPNQRFGVDNSAFLKKQMTGARAILTPEGIKLESPTNFLESLKSRNSNVK